MADSHQIKSAKLEMKWKIEIRKCLHHSSGLLAHGSNKNFNSSKDKNHLVINMRVAREPSRFSSPAAVCTPDEGYIMDRRNSRHTLATIYHWTWATNDSQKEDEWFLSHAQPVSFKEIFDYITARFLSRANFENKISSRDPHSFSTNQTLYIRQFLTFIPVFRWIRIFSFISESNMANMVQLVSCTELQSCLEWPATTQHSPIVPIKIFQRRYRVEYLVFVTIFLSEVAAE